VGWGGVDGLGARSSFLSGLFSLVFYGALREECLHRGGTVRGKDD